LSILDLAAFAGRLVAYFRNRDHAAFSFSHLWRVVILGREDIVTGSVAECAGLVDEPVEFEEAEMKASDDANGVTTPLHVRRNQNMSPLQTQGLERTDHWTNDVHHSHKYSNSVASERTLFSVFSPTKDSDHTLDDMDVHSNAGLLCRIGRGTFDSAERALVFAGFGQLLTGVVVYTGGCRGGLINSCLAHLISKFQINTFFVYPLTYPLSL
jgi:hypothetical protein